jgi:hypothetical protein
LFIHFTTFRTSCQIFDDRKAGNMGRTRRSRGIVAPDSPSPSPSQSPTSPVGYRHWTRIPALPESSDEETVESEEAEGEEADVGGEEAAEEESSDAELYQEAVDVQQSDDEIYHEAVEEQEQEQEQEQQQEREQEMEQDEEEQQEEGRQPTYQRAASPTPSQHVNRRQTPPPQPRFSSSSSDE